MQNIYFLKINFVCISHYDNFWILLKFKFNKIIIKQFYDCFLMSLSIKWLPQEEMMSTNGNLGDSSTLFTKKNWNCTKKITTEPSADERQEILGVTEYLQLLPASSCFSMTLETSLQRARVPEFWLLSWQTNSDPNSYDGLSEVVRSWLE